MYKLNHYFPSQPEIKKNTNGYAELKPIGYWFSKDIAIFYQFKTDRTSSTTLSLIPDSCVDLLFCCDANDPSAFLWTSPVQRRKQPEFKKNCTYFGVRFFPEQSLLKFNYPMGELLDKQIPLFEVMSGDQSIIEIVALGNSFSERIERFDKYLTRYRIETGKDQRLISYAIEKICSAGGILNVHELSDSIGYSEQHIRKKFGEYIGFSPKQFCQIVKFQNSLDMFLEKDETEIFDIVYENGYYDQSHFIKGFKKFIQLTPSEYKKFFSLHT